MTQLSFLDGSGHLSEPLARRTDPITSHLAAKKHRDSGKADCHAAIVLAEVRKIPGETSAELAQWSGLDRHEAARRLSDLERKGFVKKGDKRICRLRGSLMVTWFPV